MPATYANRGSAFEQGLELVHARYNRGGKTIIYRQNPRATPGKGGTVWKEKGPPDYLAVAAVYVFLADAKRTAKDVFQLADLPAHQAAAFSAHEAIGPWRVSGIILDLAGSVWWVPWSALRPVWEQREATRALKGRADKGEGSVGVQWLATNARRVTGFDWLSVASFEPAAFRPEKT